MLALDLGGTQLRTAVVRSDGTLAGRHASSTPRTASEVVRAAADQMRRSLADSRAGGMDGDVHPVAIGISAAGPIDVARGELLDPPNLDRSLWGFPLAPALATELGLPAAIERDTHVAALAEHEFGAARGLTDFVYLTVSTGVGGAVFSGGRLMTGPDGVAGELGHLSLDMDGPPCGCGARGHLEAFASGTGIARIASEADLAARSAVEVAAAEGGGDPVATEIMNRARQAFAAAAVSIVDIFNPQRIIVGGGIAIGQGDRLLGPAREAVQAHAFKRQAARVEIVPAQLGDDVGLIGALPLVGIALLGEDTHINPGAS